jgi:hypothetical protein
VDEEHRIYVIEIRRGKIVGSGEVRYLLKDSCSPFVAFSATEERVRRQGLGKRRLITMNVLTHLLFGEVLHSLGEFVDDAPDKVTFAERCWLRLVERGLVIAYKDSQKTCYKFP